MPKYRLLHLSALLALSVPLSAGTVIFSDNFDTNPGQIAVAGGRVDSGANGSFNVTAGNVDVVGPNYYPALCVSPESGSCIDTDGNTPGQITSTSIMLAPGTYTLAFDINGTQRGTNASTTATFGAFFDTTYKLASSDTNSISQDFTVNSSTVADIVFTSKDPSGDLGGTFVDNVSVTYNGPLSNPTPEPASYGLDAIAIPLLFLALRSKPRH